MSKILLTCEKPDAAKNIAEALEVPTTKIKGAYYENDKYIITWAFGHMITWKTPDEINEDYKIWSLEPLPFKFDIYKDMKVDDNQNKQKHFAIIKQLINRADVSFIINAGDADREGLLIQEEMYRFAGNKKPVKILWSQSLESKEIIKCLNNLKNREDFEPLLKSAMARSIIDYMFGISYTRAIANTIAPNVRISYGRCQTPLLKLLAKREDEIKNFKVEDYYEIKANFGNYYGFLKYPDNEEIAKFDNINEVNGFIDQMGNSGNITEYKAEKKSSSAPLLYSLSDLQKDMGLKYHFTADKTLDIAQKLYEMKLTSYPRTDTNYINDEVYNDITGRIKSACNYLKINDDSLSIDNLKKLVKPNKVSGHHAILPTALILSREKINDLSDAEFKVYDAICKRFIAIMMPNYDYESITIITSVDDFDFITKGTKTINLGYKSLYINDKIEKDEDSNDEQELKSLKKGDRVNVSEIVPLALKTQPPKRYSTHSIITLMEKYTIGRPATQASIIKRLIEMEFIEFKKNKYFVLNKGMNYVKILPNELTDSELTRNIELKLQAIVDQKFKLEDLINETYNNQVSMINMLKNSAKSIHMEKPTYNSSTEYKCPICNSPIKKQKYSYSCEKCDFKINFTLSGKTLSESIIKELLTKKITKKLDGFKSAKTGKKFSAALKIGDKGKIEFVFNFM